MTNRQTIAVNFLRDARAGRRAEVEAVIAPDFRHHNPYFAAGATPLIDTMMAAAKASPVNDLFVKHVAADGDYVWVHSHVPFGDGTPGYAVVHILRFEGDRVAEFWDVGQAIPAENPNTDGMF